MDNSEIIIRLGELIREQKKTNELLAEIRDRGITRRDVSDIVYELVERGLLGRS